MYLPWRMYISSQQILFLILTINDNVCTDKKFIRQTCSTITIFVHGSKKGSKGFNMDIDENVNLFFPIRHNLFYSKVKNNDFEGIRHILQGQISQGSM
jgi:hypothetical protein